MSIRFRGTYRDLGSFTSSGAHPALAGTVAITPLGGSTTTETLNAAGKYDVTLDDFSGKVTVVETIEGLDDPISTTYFVLDNTTTDTSKDLAIPEAPGDVPIGTYVTPAGLTTALDALSGTFAETPDGEPATAVVATAGLSQVVQRHTYFTGGRPWVDFLGLVGENQADYGAKLMEVIADPAVGKKLRLSEFNYPWLSGCDIDQSNIAVELAPGAEIQVPAGYASYCFRVKNPAAGSVTVSRVKVWGGKAIELGTLAERQNLWDYVRLHATAKGISWCRFRDTDVWYPGRMIVIKNDPVAAGFINSNKFENMEALNPRTAVVDFEDDAVSGGANRNAFMNVDGQATTFTEHGYRNIARRGNYFTNCTCFDLNQNPTGISASLAATAEATVINGGAMTQQNFIDNGINTVILSTENRYENIAGVVTLIAGKARAVFKGGLSVQAGGLELDNVQYLRWKDAAGVLQNIMRVTSGDATELTAIAKLILKSGNNSLEFFTNGVRRAFFTASGHLTIEDAVNIIFNSTTGTKIGTATTQKLGFWNATPVVRPVLSYSRTGETVAEAALRTALATAGLVTDSTTA